MQETKNLQLDKKDQKILSILDMNARMPVTQIAKKVCLSREVVNYRIKQLEKKGVIEGYYAAIDITKLGLLYCRLFFKYRKMTRKKEKELFDFCNVHPNLTWLIYGEGMFDVAITVVGKNLEVIENTYDELLAAFGKHFQNPYLTFAFKIYHYKHNCLYESHDERELLLGEGYDSIITLDSIDYKLLDALGTNADLSLVELAKKLNVTSKLIAYRIKKLKKNNIILAFRAKINTKLLGYDRYKVFLNLEEFNSKKMTVLHTYLASHQNIIYITKPMGMHNLEFEILVRNANHLHEIMLEVKDQFGDIIVNYQSNLYYSEPILTYCPIQKQLNS